MFCLKPFRLLLPAALLIATTACSTTTLRPTKLYQAGEKAEYDKLTYSVVDAQIVPRLGEGPDARIPQHRFFIVQVSVTNSGNKATNIPAMALVDDNGKIYPELADGAGIPRWLGVLRSVDPAQTEAGQVLFDAPSAHYKLRLTEETDAADIFIDIPLNFLHEQMDNSQVSSPELESGSTLPKK